MGGDVQIKKRVWKLLNDQPLSSFPASEGEEARKRFEEISKNLLAKKERISLTPYTDDWSRARQFGEISLLNPLAKRVGFYVFKEGHNPFVQATSWGMDAGDDISMDNYFKTVFYNTRCGSDDQENELKLPIDYSGVFFLDWDQDGDDDIAIFLKSGQYFFFKQKGCSKDGLHGAGVCIGPSPERI